MASQQLEALAQTNRAYLYPLLGLALFTFAYSVSTLYSIFLHPLRRVPGPFLAKFTELWRTSKYFRGNWHSDILELHAKYGPVVRVAPNEVSIVDRHGLTQVYGHAKGTKKTNWYDTWQVIKSANSFFNSTEPAEHSFLRKRVSAAYSMSNILSVESRIQEVADSLWDKFDEKARNHETISMHQWADYFAYDVVGKLTLGIPIGFIKEEKDVKRLISSIHLGFFHSANLGYLPGQMAWVRNPLATFILNSLYGTDEFFPWTFEILKSRRVTPKDPKDEKDLMDHFMGMKEPHGTPASDSSVLVELGNIIAAGADTTSIGIRTVLIQLLMHPEDYVRVQDEVDALYQSGTASSGRHGISYLAAEKLTYLNACIKEALRLHPSILWQLPREAPAAGVEIAGHYIPPSATISMSPVAQNRDRATFGADADEWRPSRWIPGRWNTEAAIKDMDKYNVTFGYGSRTCVGRNLALVELHKFIAEFVHRYDASFVNRDRPFVTKSMWFSYQDDMFLDLKLRDGVVAGNKEGSGASL